MSVAVYDLPQYSVKRVEQEIADAEKFNRNLNDHDFYEQCRRNQRFYHGDQWHGLKKSNRLQLMTSNFLQRPVSYFIAMIVSDDFGFSVKPLIEGLLTDEVYDILPEMVDRVFSRNDFRMLNRRIVKNAALECEGVLHWFFDDSVETSDIARGDIRCEVLSTCSVLFGNPYNVNEQEQPYILIKRRVPLSEMQKRAEGYGFKQKLIADDDKNTSSILVNQSDDRRITEVVKYWRESKTVQHRINMGDRIETVDKEVSTIHFCRYAGGYMIQKDIDTGLTLYPIARFNWNEQQDCYHGSCPVTSYIPTQITVNRLLTLLCEYSKHHGLPRVFYNRTMFPNGLSNDPSKAYGAVGDVTGSALQISPDANIPMAMVNLMDKLVDTTRDFIGTSDAALGNIRPDNTSAIIATQKATAAPLMVQTMNFYQYIRCCVRIVVDFISNYYGSRIVKYDSGVDPMTGEEIMVPKVIDFDSINLDEMELDIEVGQASYWSELTAVQSLDSMVKNNILPISDPEAMKIYLESLPNGYLPNREDILKYYENIIERAALAQQAQVVADQMQTQQAIDAVGGEEPAVNNTSMEGNIYA